MQNYNAHGNAQGFIPGHGDYGLVPTAQLSGLPGVPSLVFPYVTSGHLPYDGISPFAPVGSLQLQTADQLVFTRDPGAALADRLSEQLHIGGATNIRDAHGGRGRGVHFYNRGLTAHVGPLPGSQPAQTFNVYYPTAGHAMAAVARPGITRPGPGRGRGQGMPGRGQQPPRRRQQKGMEENIRRTVYISYIDLQVTEEELASFFSECGDVVDCRICGDPNSAMRFAFIEFADENGAEQALSKTGSMLGSSPLRVLPSKTAIMPVSKDLMPRSHEEIERCSRTVYVANIDKKVDRNDVKNFFEQLCGTVGKIRLLGDYMHATRIAFIEFIHAEGAMAALNCSGALLGSLPIRVSPSKTPVRPESANRSSNDQGGGSSSTSTGGVSAAADLLPARPPASAADSLGGAGGSGGGEQTASVDV